MLLITAISSLSYSEERQRLHEKQGKDIEVNHQSASKYSFMNRKLINYFILAKNRFYKYVWSDRFQQ